MLYRIFLLLLMGGSLCADVELTFLPNKAVQQKSVLAIDLWQNLPGVDEHAVMEQKLVADVKIVDRSDSPVSRPPINMLFTLRDLNISLRSDEKEAEYQVNKPNTSLFLAEIQDMVDEPIKLRFDEHFRLMPDTPGLIQLSKELPILSEIHPQSFIEELFQHLFSLAGRSLEKGKTYDIAIDGGVGIQPKSITYTILEINDQEIIAGMKGKIPLFSMDMEIQISIGDTIYEGVRFVVDGDFSGRVRWSRSNALRYTLDTQTIYRGLYKIADWERRMEISLKHQVSSS